MSEPIIHVIGVGADGPAGLRPEQIERVRAAEFLAGGERHLAFFPENGGERFVIKNNLEDLQRRLAEHRERRCVVLASGDPLFFGIARHLVAGRNMDKVRIEPATSSMQLAFARAGFPWDGAKLESIHGRDLRATLLPLLGHVTIGLFTRDGDSPAEVAAFFLDRGPLDYEAYVGENLGAGNARWSHFSHLNDLLDRRFAALNYLILRRNNWAVGKHDTYREELFQSMVPGVPDECFFRPDEGPEVMTRQEVRSVVLGKLHLRLKPGEVVWDIGAGLGTVAIEAAVLRPYVEVVAVEADPTRLPLLKKNRDRFAAWNLRVLEGKAPEALAAEALPPSRVFIGGSGGRLADILDLVCERLPVHGILVANFVTLDHLALALAHLKARDWSPHVTEIHVSRSVEIADLTSLKPQRPIFIVDAQKPDVTRE